MKKWTKARERNLDQFVEMVIGAGIDGARVVIEAVKAGKGGRAAAQLAKPYMERQSALPRAERAAFEWEVRYAATLIRAGAL